MREKNELHNNVTKFPAANVTFFKFARDFIMTGTRGVNRQREISKFHRITMRTAIVQKD